MYIMLTGNLLASASTSQALKRRPREARTDQTGPKKKSRGQEAMPIETYRRARAAEQALFPLFKGGTRGAKVRIPPGLVEEVAMNLALLHAELGKQKAKDTIQVAVGCVDRVTRAVVVCHQTINAAQKALGIRKSKALVGEILAQGRDHEIVKKYEELLPDLINKPSRAKGRAKKASSR